MFHRWLSSGCVLTWGKDTDPIQGASTLKTYLALRGSTSKHDHIECQVWTWIWDGVGVGGAHKCSVYSSPAWPWHVGPMWTRGCPSRCAGLCCPLSWGKKKKKNLCLGGPLIALRLFLFGRIKVALWLFDSQIIFWPEKDLKFEWTSGELLSNKT